MAKQTINLGAAPTGAGGDTFRSALVKAQANMDELYNAGVAVAALTGQASVDMNVFTTAGVYLFNTPSANSPGFDYGTIEVQPRTSSEIIQIARGIVSDIEMTRRYLGGAWTPWRRNFHTGNILGTVVSDMSGMAAIIETGSNANGKYTKFAGGLMICECVPRTIAVAANAQTIGSFSLPASFVDANYIVSIMGAPSANNDQYGFVAITPVNGSSFNFVHRNGVTAQNIVGARAIAIGRWF